ncbi:MAG TPA: hypothetical protein EYP04_11645 [Anaerolineae bacterium]|nr:hypothetical protein [Anaerolineae bacterium]HIQ06619.1 hypothetical protein [Anaerolineae bacterium]
MNMNVTFIGGGSVQWGPPLITDLMLTPSLASSRLVLYDIDHAAAAQMARLARRIAAETNSGWQVEVRDDLDAALVGADFVIFSIAEGGLEALRQDLEIPWRYGIAQPVGDTVGPGGIARAMRHIPVAVDVARHMEEHCPDAWFLNLTNPLTVITRAVNRETRIRAIGLCHEMTGVIKRLAGLLDISPSEIHVQVAGVNHLPWILRMRVGGQDGFALLRQWLNAHGPMHFAHDGLEGSADSVFRDRMAVKFLLFQTYGSLPGAGDRHVVEFFPAFLSPQSGYGKGYGVELTTIGHRYELLARRRQHIANLIIQPEPLALQLSDEQLAGVVAALGTGKPGRFIVNIPNVGQIDNLPRDAVVECYAHLGPNGVEPISLGALPAPLVQTLAGRVWQQEMIVDAAVKGDDNLMLQALLADPMVHDWEAARAMRDQFLAAHAEYLPL